MSLNDILTSNQPLPEPWKSFSVYNLNVTHGFTGPAGTNNSVSSSDQLLSGTLSGAINDNYVFRVSSQTINGVTTVVAHFPADVQVATSASVINFSEQIPSQLKPISSGQTFFPVCVDDNATLVYGTLTITSGGSISLGVGAGSNNFTGSGSTGIPADIFITWNLSNNQ